MAAPVPKKEAKEEESLYNRVISVIKRDWNTIPNYFSYFRLVLIPVFIWLYLIGEYSAATVIIVMSWISDVADGFIARRFNMVSEFGKVLDPIADKLTQGAIFICLSLRYPLAIVLVGIIAVKELSMLILGMVVFKRSDRVDGAEWYGKLSTGVICITAIILIIFTGIDVQIANGLLIASIVMASFAFIMYMLRFYRIFREIRADEAARKEEGK